MTLPLIVLTLLSIAGGYTAIYGHAFDAVWSQIPHPHGSAHTTILAVSVAVMVLGAGFALIVYKPSANDALESKAPVLFLGLSALKAAPDNAYNYYVAKIQQRLFAMVPAFIERIFISGIVVRGSAAIVGLVGIGARALHVGSLHVYIYWFFLGAVLLWAYAAGWLN